MHSPSKRALLASACATALLAFSACSGGDSTLTRTTATPAPLATSFTVTPTTGGSLGAEPGGAQVTVAAGVVTSAQSVSASFTAQKPPAPNKAWASASGLLSIVFAQALPAVAGSDALANATALTLRIPYAANEATAVLAAQAPVVRVAFANGTSTVLSPNASFDVRNARATVVLPRAALNNVVGVRLSLALDSASYPSPVPTGPLYYVAAPVPRWTAQPQPLIDVPTLVLVHGLFSNVQIAFPAACVKSMLAAYGYTQAVGLNYDYAQPVIDTALAAAGSTPVSPILGNFINSLPLSSATSVLVESHSYGTLVTTGALSLGTITKNVKNVVLLGGPLPNNGSPQADPGFFRYLILHAAEIEVPPSKVREAESSGMLAGLQPNSLEMERISSVLSAAPSAPNYIQVAGTHYLPDEFYIYPLYYLEFGGPFDFQTNDGVVERLSALSRDFLRPNPSVSQTSFDVDHLGLKCSNPDFTTPYVAAHLIR